MLTYYHLVWTTEERIPCLEPHVEARLYPYLVKKAGESNVYVYAINGWQDHVHLVVAIPPSLAVATAVKRLRRNTILKPKSTQYVDEITINEAIEISRTN